MSGSSFGGTVKLKGESEYKKALSQIAQNLKNVSSEIKLVTSSFDKNDTSVQATIAKQRVLTKQLLEQSEKLNILKRRYADLNEQYGKNSKAQQDLTSKIKEEKAKLLEIETTLGKNSKAYLKQVSVVSELEKTQTNYNNAISDAKIKINNAQTAINKTKSEINKLTKETDKSSDELNDMKKGFDSAGTGALKFGDILKANVLSEAIVSGVKRIAGAVKSIGSSFINIGKQALDSYADYEQLVGGVETLFKNNAKIVEEHANNAYKTSGLSANEYMETVTSFSASLLQSLNNNTKKSAEVADRAIIDMSDNANKMGTDMFMIQNAYQGFAKQNYTMLDNLKLGYGGTKEEMSRLIADASKMTKVQKELGITVDSSSMSFGNIVNAISVVQKQMGITGTTAKEASTTIQGSVSAMKSAWQNMLTGIADDNADFGTLINNLIDSIGIAMENVLPRVEIIIDGVIELIVQLGEKIVEQLPSILESGSDITMRLIDGITTMVPEISSTAFYIINEFLSSIISDLPIILQTGIDLLIELVKGIAQALPNLIPVAIDSIMTMVDTLFDNIDSLIDAGIELILGLADGLIIAIPKLIDKIPTIIDKLIDAITTNLPKLINAGITLIIKLSEGLIKAIPQLVSKIPQILNSIKEGFKKRFFSNGEYGKTSCRRNMEWY